MSNHIMTHYYELDMILTKQDTNRMNWDYYSHFIETELGYKRLKELASKCLVLPYYDNY